MATKIRWYVQDGGGHPVITAETSLGSARYKEMQILPYWKDLVAWKGVLARTIERMQKNMEDVLNELSS